ncbi:NADH:ubiquinone oxidoreductase, partial [Candidatus Zixiibacteriota bacterium]
LERLHSHLLWAGLAGHFIGYNTVFMWAWKYREPVLDMFERISGNRNHYAMMKIGGVRKDVLKKDIPDFIDLLDELTQKNDHARLKGVGVLSKKDAIDYAVLGPTARGSGYDIDVRRDEPYAAYDMLDWDVVVLQEGDVFAKAAVRLLENVESIRIIRQCLEKLQELPEGDFFTPVEEFPIGEGIGHAEAPRGEVFHYVRSDGSNNPIRHKIRAPTFQNLPSFKASCIGETVADVALITASIDPCYCCTERMVAVDVDNGQKLFDGQELIRLSQEKTERMRQKMKG